MPGAGSNKAAGYVYSRRAEGRHRHRRVFPGGILAPLLGDTADPARSRRSSSIVGSANSDVYTCVARTRRRRQDLQETCSAQEVIVGASNEGGTTRDMPAMIEQRRSARNSASSPAMPARKRDRARGRAQGDPRRCAAIGWTGLHDGVRRIGSRRSWYRIIAPGFRSRDTPMLNCDGRAAGDVEFARDPGRPPGAWSWC